MPRFLVVVDGSAEATQALERALDVAAAMAGSQIVLLGIEPAAAAWEDKTGHPKRAAVSEVLARARASAETRGVTTSSRLEQGEKGDVITRIARLETCDQIFVAEPRSTFLARICLAIAAACTGRVAGRIINATGLPVTVIAPKMTR